MKKLLLENLYKQVTSDTDHTPATDAGLAVVAGWTDVRYVSWGKDW